MWWYIAIVVVHVGTPFDTIRKGWIRPNRRSGCDEGQPQAEDTDGQVERDLFPPADVDAISGEGQPNFVGR